MQVAPVTTSAAPASSGPAEDTGSRAEQFARMLQNAFFGSGSKAVARSPEPTAPEAAQRSEQRSHELRGNDGRVTERRESQVAENRDSRQSAVPQTRPAEKTTHTVTARPAEKPAGSSDTADNAAEAGMPVDDAAEGEATEVAVAPEQTVPSETEDTEAAPQSVPVAAEMATSDLLLILNLLQNDAPASPETSQVTPTQNPVLPVQPEARAGESAVPLVLAPAAGTPALLAAADAQVAPAAPVAPAPETAEQLITAPEAAMVMAKATETSAAALLMQQQDVSPEDFAAIQQALAAQSQQAKPAAPQTLKPATPEAKPAPGATLVVEVQPGPQAPKTLIDQSALLAMQGDDASAQDAGLAFVQTQVQAAQPQPAATPEAKFAAVMQGQAEAAPQAAASPALPHAPAHLSQQAAPQAAPIMAASQATQQAATQTAARHLAGYVPAGEQVAVQIKRGIGEGLDKISIRLDPGGLGKVDVKMEVGHDGKLMAVIAAEKPETLAMLQRDVQNLEQSLRDVGLKTSTDSLSFQLRDQNQAADGRDSQAGGRQRGRAHDEYAGTGEATDPAALAAANAQHAASARGGLDIRI